MLRFIITSGLSRKAQLAQQLRKYFSKHPDSSQSSAFPFTLVLDVWAAFDDESIRVSFSPFLAATFESSHFSGVSLRQRLVWLLEEADIQTHFERSSSSEEEKILWILKPSVTNKGADINVIDSWDSLLDSLMTHSHVREWVLQRLVLNCFP